MRATLTVGTATARPGEVAHDGPTLWRDGATDDRARPSVLEGQCRCLFGVVELTVTDLLPGRR